MRPTPILCMKMLYQGESNDPFHRDVLQLCTDNPGEMLAIEVVDISLSISIEYHLMNAS